MLATKSESVILRDGRSVNIRPLTPRDTDKVVEFYANLSPETRHFYVLDNYGTQTASQLCESVAKPEKMHFVVEDDSFEIISLVKFSLDLPEAEKSRYLGYGIKLNPGTVSRCGTCISDNYQNAGLGGITLQEVINYSRILGQKTIVLSGGIFADNERAIHMCKKFGFEIVGTFTEHNGQAHVDMWLNI